MGSEAAISNAHFNLTFVVQGSVMLTTFQRFGTPMEDPTTEIPQLPVMNAEVLRDLPPELRVRSTAGSSSLQDWTRMYGGMTPDWPPGAPPPPLMHQVWPLTQFFSVSFL